MLSDLHKIHSSKADGTSVVGRVAGAPADFIGEKKAFRVGVKRWETDTLTNEEREGKAH